MSARRVGQLVGQLLERVRQLGGAPPAVVPAPATAMGHGWVRVEVSPGLVQESHLCTPAVVALPGGDTAYVCRRQYGDGTECGSVWAARPMAAYRQRVYRLGGER